MVLTTLLELAKEPVGDRRRGMHNWESMGNFVPQALRTRLEDDSMPPANKVSELLQFLSVLGLRNPSEPTSKVLASLASCAMSGAREALSLPPVTVQALGEG